MDINLEQYELIDINYIKQTDEEKTMIDIQVQDNETFFIDSNILTHNSAIAKFIEIRDPETQASMPLKGKVLNVYNMAVIDAMENAEVADIITALNLPFNEQYGDWIIPENSEYFKIKFESNFELDDKNEPIIKEVIVIGDDRFIFDNEWIKVSDIVEQNINIPYIINIEKLEEKTPLSDPDYFHFRRLQDPRGFRKQGAKYEIKLGRDIIICNDIDEIFYENKWVKVSKLLKNKNISIKKADGNKPLTMYHKKLKPSFNTILRFSKVYISTDSDPDGSSIFNLLLCLFHQYFPELFWNKNYAYINRVTYPLLSATKNKKTLYFLNRNEFEKAKREGKIDDSWKVEYYKGLGSMEKKDWKYVFDNLEKFTFEVIDDGNLSKLIKIFFDKDADIRKQWLSIQSEEGE